MWTLGPVDLAWDPSPGACRRESVKAAERPGAGDAPSGPQFLHLGKGNDHASLAGWSPGGGWSPGRCYLLVGAPKGVFAIDMNMFAKIKT